jgi:predicted Zn finger-like uncharacterized protein
MSLTRLTCPECETVMRPKVPVSPGKKVKCPKCQHIFIARGDVDEVDEVEDVEEVEEAPVKKKAKARPAEKEAKPEPKKEEEEIYGYLKEEEPPRPVKPKKKRRRDEDDDEEDEDDEDDEEEEDDGKPKINYGLDESIRDLRGPAIEKLRDPATWLTFSGLLGAVGWLVFIVILIIPFAFPIIEEEKKEDPMMPPTKEKEKGPPKPKYNPLLIWQTLDFGEVVSQPPVIFWLCIAGFFALGLYSGLIAFGGIKFLNLESRQWGIAAGIMALLPVSPAGLVFTLAMAFQWILRQVDMDQDGTDIYVTGGLGALLYLASVGLGAWTLKVANDEVVKAGYEYVPE